MVSFVDNGIETCEQNFLIKMKKLREKNILCTWNVQRKSTARKITSKWSQIRYYDNMLAIVVA